MEKKFRLKSFELIRLAAALVCLFFSVYTVQYASTAGGGIVIHHGFIALNGGNLYLILGILASLSLSALAVFPKLKYLQPIPLVLNVIAVYVAMLVNFDSEISVIIAGVAAVIWLAVYGGMLELKSLPEGVCLGAAAILIFMTAVGIGPFRINMTANSFGVLYASDFVRTVLFYLTQATLLRSIIKNSKKEEII